MQQGACASRLTTAPVEKGWKDAPPTFSVASAHATLDFQFDALTNMADDLEPDDYDGFGGNYTNCTGGSALDGKVIDTPAFQAFIFIAYSLVFVAALLGNGLVLIAVHASPRMRTVINMLLANLAAGDLLLAIACVPFSFVPTLILQHWPFGETLCKFVSYSQVS
ncbi:hypothetical protein B566_EDAN009313 [Ephemera danica]|nr:hypothetical protein B566_EDAN009313 [Ephemera danica]